MEMVLVVTLTTLIIVQMITIFQEVRSKREEQKRILAETKRILENLIPVAMGLICDRTFKGSSIDERFYILKEVYDRVPDKYKPYVTTGNLDEIVDYAYYKLDNLSDEGGNQ